jgi:hypothetical protein
MRILLYVICAACWILALGLFEAYRASRHIGVLLAGFAYGGAAVVAAGTGSWWPLLAGFATAVVLRLAGLDPASPARE